MESPEDSCLSSSSLPISFGSTDHALVSDGHWWSAWIWISPSDALTIRFVQLERLFQMTGD